MRQFKKIADKVLKEQTKMAIYKKIVTGIPVRRGLRFGDPFKLIGRKYLHDPGDFGRGIYYDTSYARAKTYGDVTKSILVLNNPIVLSVQEAYDLADSFQTVRLHRDWYLDKLVRSEREEEVRLRNAQRMTDYMISQGYDGLASVNTRFGSIEIVDYRPYKQG